MVDFEPNEILYVAGVCRRGAKPLAIPVKFIKQNKDGTLMIETETGDRESLDINSVFYHKEDVCRRGGMPSSDGDDSDGDDLVGV